MAKLKLTVILFILLIGALFYAKGGVQLPFAAGASQFVAPLFGNLQCGIYENDAPIYNKNIPASGDSIFCGKYSGAYTKQCNIQVTYKNIGLASAYTGTADVYRCTNSDDSNSCSKIAVLTHSTTYPITINANEKLFVNKKPFTGTDWKDGDVSGRATANRYGLVVTDAGARKSINNYEGCNLGNVEKGRILKGACPSQNPLPFDAFCNYIFDFVGSAGYNVFQHPTKGEVYCAGNDIYSIATITTEDNTILKVNPGYKPISDGETPSFKTIGEPLGKVQCCPNQPGCSADFTFKDEPKQCLTSAMCDNGGIPTTGKNANTIVWQECVSNQCITKEKQVQCSTDAACATGKLCDKNTWTCKDTNNPPSCGDDICSATESSNPLSPGYCQADCGTTPSGIPLWLYIVIVALIIALVVLGFKVFR